MSSEDEKKKKRKKITEAGRKIISDRVKGLMEYLEIEPKELSQACDKPIEYISRLKSGKIDPRSSTLRQIIEEGFEITEKEFYDYDNMPPKPKKKDSTK